MYGGLNMPRSVMIPAMSWCGVTSKAGLRIERADRRSCVAADVRHFARARSSIGICVAVGVLRSIVDSGAAT